MLVNEMKMIYPKEEYCMGCKLCEVHCLVQHSLSKDILKAFKNENPRSLARNIVEVNGKVSFCITCRHCNDAPCVTACMTGAMHRDAITNAVVVEKEKCVGCWMCLMVCPFGTIRRDVERGSIASKCDLCPGEKIPVCVKNCPNEALVYEER
jgi:anaerobic carbon-monoxide dehydrogenase iron sulfur subunit